MEFALTFEQAALKDAAARWVAGSHGFEEARRLMNSVEGYSPGHWREIAEMGWPALLLSEDSGGLGGSLVDAALIVEELGRGLVAAPFVSTGVASALALDAAPRSALRDRLIERLVAGELLLALALDNPGRGEPRPCVQAVRNADGWRLDGRSDLCLDGAAADGFIVAARVDGNASNGGLGLFHVPADGPGLSRRSYRTIDARTAADLDLSNVSLPADALLVAPPAAGELVEFVLDAARLMLAAEALGICEAAIEATTEYLQTRKQFGQVLSSFQVLTHRVAEMLVKKEHARSMLYRGLSTMSAPARQRSAAVSATMVALLESGEFIASQAIQLHGGIGMTDEYAVGHYYKRLRAIARTYGDLGWHLDRFSRLTQDTERAVAA